MKKKILVIAVVLMAVAMLATPLVGMVYAKPPTYVSGEQAVTGYTPIADDYKGKSDNHVSIEMLQVAWTGHIEGVAEYIGILMIHGEGVPINIHEKLHFDEVTVLGMTGSLTMQVSANLARGQDVFRWTIIDGTDGLAKVHGHGTYWLHLPSLPDVIYYYEGEVHFDP